MRKTNTAQGLLISPVRLFIFAQAFCFSSGRGQCFSPGIKSLLIWQALRLKQTILDRSAAKWWHVWLERV